MASITIKLPETLKDQAEEIAEKKGYQSKSEYVRAALRDKIERDLVVVRKGDDDEEFVTLEEAKAISGNKNESTDKTRGIKGGSEGSQPSATP